MAQITDPRQGFGRTKQLLTKMAAKAMARKGYKSKVSTFGKIASNGILARNLRPFSRPGNANRRGARPQGYGDHFDGMNVGHQNGERAGGYVNTAPVQAARPYSYQQGTPQDMGQPLEETGVPDPVYTAENPMPGSLGQTPNPLAGTPDTTPGYGLPDGVVPENYNPNPDPGMSIWGVPLDQTSPSGTITAPGGLIPLGGGRYYDPETDLIRGGGYRAVS